MSSMDTMKALHLHLIDEKNTPELCILLALFWSGLSPSQAWLIFSAFILQPVFSGSSSPP